jgi:hypothetical protein
MALTSHRAGLELAANMDDSAALPFLGTRCRALVGRLDATIGALARRSAYSPALLL